MCKLNYHYISNISITSIKDDLKTHTIKEEPKAVMDSKSQLDINAALESRKKLEEEIIRCTEEFDKQQMAERNQVEVQKPSQEQSRAQSKSSEPVKKEETQSAQETTTVTTGGVTSSRQIITRSQVAGILKVIIIAILGCIAGALLLVMYVPPPSTYYFINYYDMKCIFIISLCFLLHCVTFRDKSCSGYHHALDTRAYRLSHPMEFDAIFSPDTNSASSGGVFSALFSFSLFTGSQGNVGDTARERLKAFANSHYSQVRRRYVMVHVQFICNTLNHMELHCIQYQIAN